MYSNYYTLLNSLSTLTKTVLEADVKECLVAKTEKKKIKKEMLEKEEDVSDELSALLGDDLAMKSKKEEVEEAELELDESTEEVVEEELIADSSMESSTSEEPAFLTASSENYTINVATTNGLSTALSFFVNILFTIYLPPHLFLIYSIILNYRFDCLPTFTAWTLPVKLTTRKATRTTFITLLFNRHNIKYT